MGKEYSRSFYVETIAKDLGFTKLQNDLYEKKINSCSKFQIQYIDCRRHILLTYYILVESANGITRRISKLYVEELFNTYNNVYKDYLKHIMLDLIINVHYEILLNSYAKD